MPANPLAPRSKLAWSNPVGGVLCRYLPLGGAVGPGIPHGRLYGRATLNAALAKEAVSILDEQRPQVGVPNCPTDFGAWDLVVLRYGRHPPLTIAATASGCPSFTNGIFRTGSFSPANESWMAIRDLLVPTTPLNL